MISTIKHWLEPPQFEDDEEKNRFARLINTLGLYFALLLVLAEAIYVPFFAINKLFDFIIFAILMMLYGISRYLLFRGRVQLASTIIVITAWAIFHVLAVFSGGVNSLTTIFIVGVGVIIGLLIRSRLGYLLISLSILLELGLAVLQASQYPLPAVLYLTPLGTWFGFTLTLGFVYSVANLVTRNLQNALDLARQEIAARQQVERTLRTSESRFRAVVENSNDGIIFGDAHANILYRSPSYIRINGFTDEERVGHSGFETVHPDDLADLRGWWAKLLEQPEISLQTEYRVQHKDGSWRWIETNGQNLLGNPDILSVVITSRDITERKLTEEALRESEERYKLMFESAPIAINITYGTEITYANMAYLKMFGFSNLNELQGIAPLELFTPEHRPQILENIQRRAQGLPVPDHYEAECFRKDGARFPILMYLTRTTFADGLATVGFIIDVTENKQAEEALHRRADELALLQATVLDITTPNDLPILLQTIVERAAQLLGARSGGLYLCDPRRAEVRCVVSYNTVRDFTGTILKYGEGAAGVVAQTGQPLIINDYRYWDKRAAVYEEEAFSTILSAPMIWHDQVTGVIHVLDDVKNRRFTESDLALLTLFASHATIAVENTRLYREAQNEITERKRTEDELRRSEARYRLHFENVADVIYTLDHELRITSISPSVEKTLGYLPDELVGKTFPELGVLAPEFLGAAITDTLKIFGGEQVKDEYNFIAKNGTRLIGEITASPLRDANDQIVGVLAVARDITERKQRENEMQAIATLSAALRTAPTRSEMLPVLTKQLVALLNCDAVSVEIIDPLSGDAITEVAHGPWKSLVGTRQKSGTGINAIISQTLQPYFTNDLNRDQNFAHPELIHKDLHGGIGAPLIAQDQLIGFVWMGRQKEVVKSDVRLLTAIADITANAIHRATLHEQTQNGAMDLARAYDTTLEGWASALELRDHETEGHSRNVVQMTLDLASAMGIGEEELAHIRRGALLHDIGKMGIPNSILLKPNALDEGEWETMRRHPEYAYKLLKPIEYLHPVLDIPYCHHERWDGTGYPRGLKGEEIPLAARIFTIVDVWDALTSNRPYHMAWTKDKALAYIAEQSGKQFDPAVVSVFLKFFQ